MHIFSLTPFFKKNTKQLSHLDTILIKNLKNLESQNHLNTFAHLKIYHHNQDYEIELLLFDKFRGIYLFEIKTWTYKELKNATIKQAQEQDNAQNTLAFEKTHKIIEKKLNELTNKYDIPIYNYLLMENLNADEYENLDDSFKKLLPQQRVIFSDTPKEVIIQKLQNIPKKQALANAYENVMENLLVQYAILDNHSALHLCTLEQREFIDSDLHGVVTLYGLYGSGKSNIILLKALVELLEKKAENIIIIKPTKLACDLFKRKLLTIIEHAIIEIDLNVIKIIVPHEFEEQTLKHRTTVICDDAQLMKSDFIDLLQNRKKISHLLLVKSVTNFKQASLKKNFRIKKRTVNFYKMNLHKKALHLISEFTNTKAQNVLIVSNILSREKLKDALETFIEKNYKILDSDVSLVNQENKDIILATYKDINEVEAEHIILMDIPFLSKNEIEYAFNLASKTVDVLYEEDCEEIRHLRRINENN